MSKLSSLKARFARLAPAPAGSRIRSAFGGPRAAVLLELSGERAFDRRVAFARALMTHGLTMREAHSVLGRLAGSGMAVASIQGADAALAGAFAEFGVRTSRPRVPDVEPQAVREMTGLSQPEFAARYGFSGATIKNWEQGRARPDAAARLVLWLIANDPRAVDRALGLAKI